MNHNQYDYNFSILFIKRIDESKLNQNNLIKKFKLCNLNAYFNFIFLLN
jgi:hypothetical protein